MESGASAEAAISRAFVAQNRTPWRPNVAAPQGGNNPAAFGIGTPGRDPVPGSARFASLVLPHLDAGYNLARWLLHDAHDARDATQEACVRASRSIATRGRLIRGQTLSSGVGVDAARGDAPRQALRRGVGARHRLC
jgi:hypothetical protein